MHVAASVRVTEKIMISLFSCHVQTTKRKRPKRRDAIDASSVYKVSNGEDAVSRRGRRAQCSVNISKCYSTPIWTAPAPGK